MAAVDRIVVPAALAGRRTELSGWGGGPRTPATIVRPADEESLVHAVAAGASGAIARGMGRSYGDAALLRDGLVLDLTALRDFAVAEQRGVVRAHAGVTLAALLRTLVPRGWVLPVLPGTQHVTVGGMLASDVHGKNHSHAGSIGAHVAALKLLTSAGELLELEPGRPDGFFEATIGGMGLTGVIVWAEIRLRRVTCALVSVDTDRVQSLDAVLAALREPGGEHSVAWLDLLSTPGRVRGVVTRASYAEAAPGRDAAPASPVVVPRATVPSWWPARLPRAGVRAFNELRFRASPIHQRGRLEPIAAHMFPLDRLAAWPRLYGRAGLIQYQFAVPYGHEDVLEQVLGTLESHRVPCFLAVLKDFGEAGSAHLSFPIPGWTLALDLPRAAAGLEAALLHCDELVAGAGGRVYLTKDARLRAEQLGAMYPRLGEWRARRDALDPSGRWRSELGIRLGLVA
jgi:decaprenylphospho-beta-D-ribofuranose 2-oxidase